MEQIIFAVLLVIGAAVSVLIVLSSRRVFVPRVGQNIGSAATDLCMLSRAWPAEMEFNGIVLRGWPWSRAGELAAQYHATLESDRRRYQESDEGKAAEVDRLRRVAEAQTVVDAYVTSLHNAEEMTTQEAVDFMAGIRDATDLIGVDSKAKTIVLGFERLGFVAGVRCGDDFDGDDPEIYGRWLVGRALDGLSVPPYAIHQVFWKFHKEYQAMSMPAEAVQ